MTQDAPIGGFFGLELPLRARANSLWALWRVGKQSHALFANARSALFLGLKHRAPKRLWLPAYCGESLVRAAVGAVTDIRFFPLMQNLSPDDAFLARHVEPNDAVLAIDYFGRAPSDSFLAFVKKNPKILWIEDRSQAMHTGVPEWGELVIYSPRKLLGVPDGGIIVSRKKDLPELETPLRTAPDYIHGALMRYEDRPQQRTEEWSRIFAEQEQNQKVSAQGMSRLSHAILLSTPARPLIQSRIRNEGILRHLLGDLALLPPSGVRHAPFGFPIRVPYRQKLAAHLHGNGIYPAQHWPSMPSPLKDFTFEHALCDAVITLPVDQRYGAADMQRIAAMVREGME